MIYFIQSGGNNGPIKIGYTSGMDAERRLSALQVGSPNELSFLGFMEGGLKEELDLHSKFSKDRLRGEWFNPSQELLELISKINLIPNDTYNISKDYNILSLGLKDLLNQYEKTIIEKTLRICEGNKSLTAKLLKITRPTLHAKIKQYKIEV